MRHLSYVAMLVFCLAGTVPLGFVFKVRSLKRIRRLALAIACAAVPFVIWDVIAARNGQWHFAAGQTLPMRLLGLPVEEWCFFVVIPFAAIATYSTVGEISRRRRQR
ncbi:lycopene cyclase domain-containing protein [Rudaeicoccus suwonensis]|uniref:Lycopene cyclase domain-containing protein n=1 Tax=Rudaeicoccus suwonensis TaxID=657409 RepID=A0A561EBM9_9MICO|nr:lycopene cyclase domain-containing protein [Rudaeicoccus suwonensis]TWE13002.1 lycopene cyclase domain-containing protein [Rudaeicoccus suwonensis]